MNALWVSVAVVGLVVSHPLVAQDAPSDNPFGLPNGGVVTAKFGERRVYKWVEKEVRDGAGNLTVKKEEVFVRTLEDGESVNPSEGHLKLHGGVDYSSKEFPLAGGAPTPMDFMAGVHGKVVAVNPEKGFVRIQVDNLENKKGNYLEFAHASAITLKPADVVTPRTKVGRTGRKGTNAIHLHVQARNAAFQITDLNRLLQYASKAPAERTSSESFEKVDLYKELPVATRATEPPNDGGTPYVKTTLVYDETAKKSPAAPAETMSRATEREQAADAAKESANRALAEAKKSADGLKSEHADLTDTERRLAAELAELNKEGRQLESERERAERSIKLGGTAGKTAKAEFDRKKSSHDRRSTDFRRRRADHQRNVSAYQSKVNAADAAVAAAQAKVDAAKREGSAAAAARSAAEDQVRAAKLGQGEK